MKKNINGIKKVLVVGAIGPDGWFDKLQATPSECEAISKRLKIPGVKKLCATIRINWKNDIICVQGHLSAQLLRECVVSLDLFTEIIDTDFEALFSEDSPTTEKEVEMKDAIDPIDRGRLDLFEILTEQVGLTMDPFPHKPGVSGNYAEFSQHLGHKPFSNLKKMIKND